MALIAHPDSGLLLVGSPPEGGTGLLAVSRACCCDQSGSGEPEFFDCCPDTPMPTHIHAVVSNRSQDCDCLPDSFDLFRLASQTYVSDFIIDCSGGVATDFVTLECGAAGHPGPPTFSPEGWHPSASCASTWTYVSESCDPWQVVFDVTTPAAAIQPASCCPTLGGTFRVTFTF
jgi:hypothetical protein